MLSDKSNIDQLFSEGLKAMEVSPDPVMWDRINQQMGAQKRKRRGFFYLSLAASVALLLAFGAGYFLSGQDIYYKVQPMVHLEHAVQDMSSTGAKVAKLQEQNSQELKGIERGKVKSSYTGILKDAPVKTIVVSSDDKKEVIESRWLPSLAKLGDLRARLFAAPNGIDNIQPETLEQKNAVELNDKKRILYNQMLLAQNNEAPRTKRKWSVLGQVSPSIGGYGGGHDELAMAEAGDFSNTQTIADEKESGLWSVGGGVKLNIPTGKRLSFQTGLYYSRLGQKSSQGGVMSMAYAGEKSNGFNSSLGNASIRTAAGYVKIRETGSSRSFQDADKSNTVKYDIDPRAMGGELKQYFETIELPLLLKYNLINRRLSFHLLGGVSTNFVVGNKVYLDTGEGDKYIGETSDIQRTNFSTNLGFGLEYGLSSRIRLSLEPGLKFYMNSISKNSDFNYKPYSLGVYTGLSFQF